MINKDEILNSMENEQAQESEKKKENLLDLAESIIDKVTSMGFSIFDLIEILVLLATAVQEKDAAKEKTR